MVGERLSVPCELGSTPTLLIIFCGIQVMSEYWAPVHLGWEARFTDYSTVVPSGRWRSGFHVSGRAKGLATVEQSNLAKTPDVMMVDISFLAVKKTTLPVNFKLIIGHLIIQ
ncbi:hypothetical protein HanIR_Chr03g0139961 [Helianthus annuus]|nr:hypothetical protein HanIR_Chr03g0139961 [Helianthus annuus]